MFRSSTLFGNAEEQDPSQLEPRNAFGKGPIRTKIFWDLPDENRPEDSTVEGDARFVYADQNMVTRLWNIYTVTQTESSTAPGAKMEVAQGHKAAVPFLEALQILADYERIMAREGVEAPTEDNVFKFQDFRDFAKKEGIVFCQETSRPVPLSNGAFPSEDGSFLGDDIQEASDAFAKTMQAMSTTHPADQIFASPNRPFDVNSVLADAKMHGALKAFNESFDRAIDALKRIQREDELFYYERGWDSDTKVSLTKTFNKHMKAARKTFAGLPDDRKKKPFEDAMLALQISYDIMALQVEFLKVVKGSNIASDAESKFKSSIEKTREKYESQLSQASLDLFANAALVAHSASVPRALYNTQSQFSQAETDMRQQLRAKVTP